ncbi:MULTISPECIES: LysR family transcriptional regulator [unclassified Halomonas]|uniref:LysR family transcriptional regulator n=1 Tax=unclassified Halomonas TaxID=2609666 RepID=UPI00054EE6D3|nr:MULTISPECIES: LysR family transcriptional regulator [unclassified Halomonas]CEP34386.1 Transcriptional regulator [Halomonas sp. R57-5]
MDTNKLLPLLTEMAVFVKTVESGSFSKTAKVLGVAPSSISRSITRLEAALEEKLLERTTRKMRLTPIGQKVFILCRNMLESAQMAVSAAHSDKNEISGSLRVAAPKALSKQVLMPMILEFTQANPKVSFQLKVTDHPVDPVGDDVDVFIHITENPIEGLISKNLGNCRLILCASTSYIQEFGVPSQPEDLLNHNCLSLGETPRDRVWVFKNNNQKIPINIKGTLTVNHSEIRREAVLKGRGVSIFPDFVISAHLASNEVTELLKDWHISGSYQGKIIAQYAQSKYMTSQLKAFINFIKDRFDSGYV